MKTINDNDNKDKKQRILDAALTLFRQTHNVNKVSIEAIAKQAKVSPTTIYNNFGTRENLVYEVIKVIFSETIERNRNLIYSDIPFPQKLISVINGKMDMTSKLNEEILEKIINQDESIIPLIDNVFESEIRPLWIKLLMDGKKEEYIDVSLDNDTLIIYLDVLLAGFRAKQDVLLGFADKIDLIKQLTQIMFYGFLKKEIDLFNNGGK